MRPEFDIFRHQEAEYKLNKKVLDSDDPQGPILAEQQDFETDLTEQGQEHAREQAAAFFQRFDPNADAFFVASSDLVRAAETAKIYVDVAEELGFEIISPENPHSATVEHVGAGKVKHLETLSLNIDNALIDQLFDPNTDFLKRAQDRGVTFDEGFVQRWQAARKIIEQDNKGSWSENLRYHGDTVAEILPEIGEMSKTYDRKFQNLVRLMKFGDTKISGSGYAKRVNVLAFTHENLFTRWLAKEMNEHGLELGEMISFRFDPSDMLHATVRDKSVVVD
jgi:phosphohistidine phosphatase SixA